MELNSSGKKKHAFSLEMLWLPVLMSAKHRENV